MKIFLYFFLVGFSHSVTGQTFYNESQYTDASEKKIVIENSYPKGGLTYTNLQGEHFVYVIFWTRITNKTDTTVELCIDFTNKPHQVPASFNTQATLFVPPNTMTLDKIDLFNYGFDDLISFLDNNDQTHSGLQKTLVPNETHLLYTIALFNKGIEGVVRAGYEFDGTQLIYKITEAKIPCGHILVK